MNRHRFGSPTPWVALAMALALCAAPGAAPAAYLEDSGSRELVRPEPQPPPPPPPERVIPPHVHNPLQRLLQSVSVSDPIRYRDLTIYPLVLGGGRIRSDVRTLDEALSRGWLTIRERDAATVASLQVRNESGRHVLLVAGEILVGGRQNRIVRDDTIVAPGSGFIDVAVYCGEQQRWAGRDDAFGTRGSLAHPQLRESAAKGASQESVWGEIADRSGRAEVSSPTRDYQQIYEDGRARRSLDEYAGGFGRWRTGATVGFVAVSGYRILGAEVFGDASLLDALWDKLVRSYAVDVVYSRYERGGVSVRDVRQFIEGAVDARYSGRYTSGSGRLWEIDGGTDGAGITLDEDAVHVHLFRGYAEPAPPPVPLPPVPRPPIRPMPYPEERLWRE